MGTEAQFCADQIERGNMSWADAILVAESPDIRTIEFSDHSTLSLPEFTES
jgi:hypothetical protein